MNAQERKELQIAAAKIRLGIIEGVFHAKSGHPGGSLSAAELFAYLYGKELNVDPKNPKDPDRDRFVLSKGHCAPGYYAALALKGFFPMEELQSLRHIGAMLQGHPDMKHTPGVDMSSGSLGQGISAAVGMALAGKMDRRATASTPCWGTASARRARCGRPPCSPGTTVSITSASSWTTTACRSTGR